MEIDQSAVRTVGGENPTNSVVIQGPAQAEPAKEVVSRPDVVAGEDVQPPQPPQQDVLPGPASHAADSQEAVQGGLVGLGRQRFEIQVSLGDGSGQLDQGASLLAAESQGTQLLRLQP